MNKSFEVLIDSDAFVGSMVDFDVHHDQAAKLFETLNERGVSLVTTSLVVAETATVISHRVGQTTANLFLSIINRGNIPVIHIDEKLQREALHIFSEQTKKRTSVTDCANVAVIRQFNIPIIFSFDRFYDRKCSIKLASQIYSL